MYRRLLRHVVRKSGFAYLSPYSARLYSKQKKSKVPEIIPKTSKPLRILFCGSDSFSIASLKALYEEQQRDPEGIQSIDVLCRPGKRVGRSLKKIQDVPIKDAAKELGLRVHERDTFTGWDLPQAPDGPINLIIAVSFGKFVPPRILNSVEYGGLNVHPSLLPQFRGSAPLQHTIMTRQLTTGITLQTLDEKSFDHGVILAQSRPNGLQIPNPYKCTYDDLLEFVTPKAAEMLVQGIRNRVFVPPLQDVGWMRKKEPLPAPKITSADREVDWMRWPATKIERYHRALGRLWSDICPDNQSQKRAIFEDMELVPMPDALLRWMVQRKSTPIEELDKLLEANKIEFMVISRKDGWRRPLMYVVDGDAILIAYNNDSPNCIRVSRITVEGDKKRVASQAVKQFTDPKSWLLAWGQKGMMARDVNSPIRNLFRSIALGDPSDSVAAVAKTEGP